MKPTATPQQSLHHGAQVYYTRPRMYLCTYAYDDDDTNELYSEYHLGRQVLHIELCFNIVLRCRPGVPGVQEGDEVLRLAPGDAGVHEVDFHVSGTHCHPALYVVPQDCLLRRRTTRSATPTSSTLTG